LRSNWNPEFLNRIRREWVTIVRPCKRCGKIMIHRRALELNFKASRMMQKKIVWSGTRNIKKREEIAGKKSKKKLWEIVNMLSTCPYKTEIMLGGGGAGGGGGGGGGGEMAR
jgi:hypothetical protein